MGDASTYNDQIRILQKQLEWEDVPGASAIITDSPIFFGFCYTLDIPIKSKKDLIFKTDFYKMLLKANFPHRYDVVFLLSNVVEPQHDGVRPNYQFDENWRNDFYNTIKFTFQNVFPSRFLVGIDSRDIDERVGVCLEWIKKIKNTEKDNE